MLRQAPIHWSKYDPSLYSAYNCSNYHILLWDCLEPVPVQEGQRGIAVRMMIEMQLREDNTESNLFIYRRLQSSTCLLSFQTWQTNKYMHLCINAHRCPHIRFMKGTEVLRLSRRWNLEKQGVLHLHFNLLSFRLCVWCCSKIAWCLHLVPIYREFRERRALNSNPPAITAYGDEASSFFSPLCPQLSLSCHSLSAFSFAHFELHL